MHTTAKPNAESRNQLVLRSLFAIDIRSLAAVRMGLTAIILYRASPREASTPLPHQWESLSIPLAVMLLFGYKTRLATALTWLVYTVPIRDDLLTSGVIRPGGSLAEIACQMNVSRATTSKW